MSEGSSEAAWLSLGGRVLLIVGFASSLLLVVLVAWVAPELALVLPVLLLGGFSAWFVVRRPLLNLCLVLSLFVLMLDLEEGFQVTEIFYGLYYLGYLATWGVLRFYVFEEGRSVLNRPEAWALFLLLIYAFLTLGLTLLYKGSLPLFVSEWTALLLIGFYFPVREACARYQQGMLVMLVVVLWVGLFAAVTNLLNYRAIIANASHLSYVAGGRVALNDTILMTCSVFSLAALVHLKSWSMRFGMGALFLLYVGSLILTQSRGYWAAFLLAALVLFFCFDRAHRTRLVVAGLASLVALGGLAYALLGEALLVVGVGLLDRLASLQDAATGDVSLINRWIEASAVFDRILENPLLGHGMGVKFSNYDLVHQSTRVRSFMHNGYISLWYRFGLPGLCLFLFFWFKTIGRGLQAFSEKPRSLPGLGGLVAAATLTAITLVTNTSNAFHLNENTFVVGLVAGIASGAYERLRTGGAAA